MNTLSFIFKATHSTEPRPSLIILFIGPRPSLLCCKHTQIMADYEEVIEMFSGFLNEEMEKTLMSKFSQLMSKVTEITSDEKSTHLDKDVEAIVNSVETSVTNTFVLARCYVAKCNELAEYIVSEEPCTISAIESCNSEELGDYLGEVLDKSRGCQKDIRALIETINVHDKTLIAEQESAIENKKSQANKKAYLAAGGGAIAIVLAAAGPAGVILFPAIPAAIGLGVAILGLTLAIKACDAYIEYQGIIQCCIEALEVIRDLKTCLIEMEERLEHINLQLKEAIDDRVGDVDDKKLNKLSKGSRPVIHSLIRAVKGMSVGAKKLQLHCQPLIDAKTLEEFMKLL